jgi:hypothetical protein
MLNKRFIFFSVGITQFALELFDIQYLRPNQNKKLKITIKAELINQVASKLISYRSTIFLAYG